MRTPFQQQIHDRVARYVEREGLTSIMSNTKWRRMLQAIDSLPFAVTFRFKDVRDAEATPTDWDPDRAHNFGFLSSVEWLEIKPLCSESGGSHGADESSLQLRQAMQNARLPFSIVDGHFRVWGYIRPGMSPAWEPVG